MDALALVRAFYALAVVAALLFALRLALREVARGRLTVADSTRFVRVLETTMLPHDAALVVIRVGDAYHLIGAGQGRVTPICEVGPDVAARVAASHRARRGSQRLARLRALLRV